MTEKPTTSNKDLSPDWFLRGALTRIGDTIDRFTGRRWVPSSSLATSELIERIKKLLDSEAKEVAGKGKVVPHNIKLKMQWDKFSTDSDGALEKLENELLAAAADHINDSLYYTYAPLQVQVKPDYFTEGVKLFVSFDKFSDEEQEAEVNVTIPAMTIQQAASISGPIPPAAGVEIFIARFEINGNRKDKRFEIPPKGRITVGRTGGNDLIIEDSSVSKIHAALVSNAEGVLSVADTGSTNGTFVNGERISYGKAMQLSEGDRVKFGEVEVVFEHIQKDEMTAENDSTEIGGLKFTTSVSDESPDASTSDSLPSTTFKIDPEAENVDDSSGESEVTT